MQEVCKERTEPAHAGLLFCPVRVQTAYRIVNVCHRKDPAPCDILSPSGMGPEKSWCWDPGFSHRPRRESPASASATRDVLRKHLWCARSLGPELSFSDLPSEVADGRERAKTCQEHWKRARHISRVSPGASSKPEDLFPNFFQTFPNTSYLAHAAPWDLGGVAPLPFSAPSCLCSSSPPHCSCSQCVGP